MGTIDLGRAFPVSHGDWVSGGGTGTGGAYERLSIVRHLGITWISAVETTEEPTIGATDWDIMVEDTNEFVKPVVDTVSVAEITGTSATVTINLQKFGFVVTPNVGVEYRKAGATTWSRTATQTPTAIGSMEVDVSGLALSTNYEVRAFAIDPKNPDILSVGDILPFSTTSAYIATPTVSVSGYPGNISTTPTLTTSAFSAVGAPDTHASTTWRIKNSGGTVVWESLANTTNKTYITVPTGYLQPGTTYKFEAIHIGQTLGSSAVGSISATTATTPLAGEAGFGVGVAPDTLVAFFGLTPMTGYNDPTHANYGNYTDASGSVMGYIPKHYVKYSHNPATPYYGTQIDISSTYQNGYALPRCFVNNGVEVAGIFVDKYFGGKEGTVMVSKRNLDPVSTRSDHNPITALTANSQTPTATLDGMYAAVKTRGSNYSVPMMATYTMLADLADAHYQACHRNNDFTYCAWADILPHQPKGNNNNALKDANDANVVYTSSGYEACGLTGGVADSVFAKITHNGQKCGITDLNGNMWEVASGYITSTSGVHLTLKESFDVKNLTAAEAYNINNYDVLTMPLTLNNTVVAFGNGTNQFFSGDTVRTSNAYRLDNLGLPMNDSAVSASGTNRFGGDNFTRYQVNGMCSLVSGNWGYSGMSGVRARNLANGRSGSDANVGGRACLVPSVAG